jgi:mannitol/fructose-specific phosphotransferase system IIA component (Ntr-type)
MKISQLLNKNSIISDLKARDKENAINELAKAISQSTKPTTDQITTVLM